MNILNVMTESPLCLRSLCAFISLSHPHSSLETCQVKLVHLSAFIFLVSSHKPHTGPNKSESNRTFQMLCVQCVVEQNFDVACSEVRQSPEPVSSSIAGGWWESHGDSGGVSQDT